jgi:hypothetical protein
LAIEADPAGQGGEADQQADLAVTNAAALAPKSHNRPACPARRLTIEATYSL